jgi:hypothetical protein
MTDVDDMVRDALREEAGRARFDPGRWDPSITELPVPRRPRLRGLGPVPRALARVAVAAVLAAAIAGPLLLMSRLGTGTREDRPGQTVSPSPTPTGDVRHSDSDDGLSIRIPMAWTFHQDPSGPAEPRTVFAVGSWLFAKGGDCAPTAAQAQLPRDGVFLWLIEYRDPQGNVFPQRGERFELDEATLANYECSIVPSYLIRFVDAGRSFQVHVAFGPEASGSLRQEVLRALDSLEVTAPVPDGCPPEVASSGDPDCPEHAWLEAIVEAAGHEVTGNTGSAVVGEAGGVEFGIWTTVADPDDPYIVPPEAGFDEEIYITYQNVADITVYTDGTRFVWTVQGFHVWLGEGLSGPPRVRAIEPLVRASLMVDYDAIDTRP